MKTPWFPPHMKPVRPGFYEVRTRLICFQYWNGQFWEGLTFGPYSNKIRSLWQNHEWRGLTEPKEAQMKLYTSPAGIACADCGYGVKFDYEPTCWKAGMLHGKCINSKCANHNRTFRFPLASVEVDFVEEQQP